MNAEINLKDVVLETDRLILREWKETDLNDFFEYASVDGVGQMVGREIGYVLSKDYWGQGLMPEAVKAVINYCFETAGCDYLLCSCSPQNIQSARVIEKCGFRFVLEKIRKLTDGSTRAARYHILDNPNK